MVRQLLRISTITLFILLLAPSSFATDNNQCQDDDDGNIISQIIDYIHQSNKHTLTTRPNFSLLGGPFYTNEKGFGLGIIVAGDYSTCPSDSLLPTSNVSLIGKLASNNYYSTGIKGVHVFPNDTRRINYDVDFVYFSTYFWGIGYESGCNNDNETPYNLFEISVSADYKWKLPENLLVGPAIKLSYTNAHDISNPSLWGDERLRYPTVSAGITFQSDTRDNLTAPKRGHLIEFSQLFAPRFLGNSNHSYSDTELNVNIYRPLWSGCTFAGRFHGEWTFGNTPWGNLPITGKETMRGYYEGRYRDKCASDVTIELRQHIYRRSGIAVWSGVGTVYRKFSDIHFKRLLPEAGIGYRWEFKKNSNIRLDIGFGKNTKGVQFGINESF